jgi:hypothetical protein
MNVQVKHEGVNVTGFCISYERIHKICTGIGTLSIEFADSISRTFLPWQSIDIWENGDFKVRYYISSVEHNIARSTIVLDCQDNSKRIVDYFIPDSYTVDYPSYTRYWIEKFLTEAGVSFEFNTASQGTLLSNFTNLGLTTVYEQITTLLQMSGWYFYFDGNGKAIIGSLNVDFAEDHDSVGKTDILDIAVIKDDKMLRNKALVFGAYDPYSGTNAKASVSVHTPWNYDQRDLRTVVISNSNIPDSSTAYGMANQIIKEFARITVEKHITVWGARDFNLGTALRVTSNVWRGRGLITTFGVSMSKQGLVTNVVLDERCPRLFGFFDFGDYVYVSFYGDGVWRKHIKFDPIWYNFSTGLTDLGITDLYINNGIFGSVGTSGELYYAVDNLPWHQITITGLMSSLDDVVSSGNVILQNFSGIMARAVTVDKLGNTVKYGVDTYSGINTGDYFITDSGMTNSSVAHRGWIVEYDPFTGLPVGDLGSGIYPISLSGNYNMSVLDIENDGRHDYVSVKTGGTILETLDGNYNLGKHQSQPFGSTSDDDVVLAFPTSSGIYLAEKTFANVTNENAMIVISNAITNERKVVYQTRLGASPPDDTVFIMKEVVFTKTWDEYSQEWYLGTDQITSDSTMADQEIIALYQSGTYIYDLYYYKFISTFVCNLYKRTWNSQSNAFGTEVLVGVTDTTPTFSDYNAVHSRIDLKIHTIVVDNILYIMFFQNVSAIFGAFGIEDPSAVTIYMSVTSLITGATSSYTLYQYVTEHGMGSTPNYEQIPHGEDGPKATLLQDVNGIKIVGWFPVDYHKPTGGFTYFDGHKDFLIAGNHLVIQENMIYADIGDDTDPAKTYFPRTSVATLPGSKTRGRDTGRLNKSNGFLFINVFDAYASDYGITGFTFNGTTYTVLSTCVDNDDSLFCINPARIYPLFIDGSYYIAKDMSDNYWMCDATSISPLFQITPPAGYILVKPISPSTLDSTSQYYWAVQDTTNFYYHIMPATATTYLPDRVIQIDNTITSDDNPSFLCGEILFSDIDYTNAASTSVDDSEILYIDMKDLVSTGGYMVLQRNGSEFKLIELESYPIRLDISNNSPVLTVGSGDSTFVSNYVYDTELIVIEAVPSGLVSNRVNDYRYTLLEPALASGIGISTTILYVTGSGIFGTDALTYSGGFTQMFSIPSGEATRIETSNYGLNGQYIFVTASGNVQTFYQQDPASFAFVDYGAGFPQTRATSVRLDDAV